MGVRDQHVSDCGAYWYDIWLNLSNHVHYSCYYPVAVKVGDKYSRVVSPCHCPRISPLFIQHAE